MTEDAARYVTQEEMDSTTTGQNMRQGTFVLPIVNYDPTGETRSVEDGAARLWVSDGQLKMSVFSLELNEWTTFSAGADTSTATAAPSSQTPIFVPAEAFILATGTPTLAVIGSTGGTFQKAPAWAFDATVDESVTTMVWIPEGQTFTTVTMYYAFSDANSGDAYMSTTGAMISSGEQIDQNYEFIQFYLQSSPLVADQLVAVSYTGLPIGTGTGEMLRLNSYRNGTHVSDTYGADVWFLGALISE